MSMKLSQKGYLSQAFRYTKQEGFTIWGIWRGKTIGVSQIPATTRSEQTTLVIWTSLLVILDVLEIILLMNLIPRFKKREVVLVGMWKRLMYLFTILGIWKGYIGVEPPNKKALLLLSFYLLIVGIKHPLLVIYRWSCHQKYLFFWLTTFVAMLDIAL